MSAFNAHIQWPSIYFVCRCFWLKLVHCIAVCTQQPFRLHSPSVFHSGEGWRLSFYSKPTQQRARGRARAAATTTTTTSMVEVIQ